jgi:hypothetical protein
LFKSVPNALKIIKHIAATIAQSKEIATTCKAIPEAANARKAGVCKVIFVNQKMNLEPAEQRTLKSLGISKRTPVVARLSG